MTYPWYGVSTKFFTGILYSPMHAGFFYTLEEAKACYDSIDLKDEIYGVYLAEFHEDSCKTLFSKERKLNPPTPETMGRARYITRAEIKRSRKEDAENGEVIENKV